MAAKVHKTGLGIKDLLLPRRQKILDIADKHGAFNVRVFGSVARGEATAQSDVDLLVDYDSARTTPWFPASLQSDLEDLLERSVDVATEGGLGRIKQRVLAEAVEL